MVLKDMVKSLQVCIHSCLVMLVFEWVCVFAHYRIRPHKEMSHCNNGKAPSFSIIDVFICGPSDNIVIVITLANRDDLPASIAFNEPLTLGILPMLRLARRTLAN